MNDTHPPLPQKRNAPFLPTAQAGGILARNSVITLVDGQVILGGMTHFMAEERKGERRVNFLMT
jgi:hypothetical protein